MLDLVQDRLGRNVPVGTLTNQTSLTSIQKKQTPKFYTDLKQLKMEKHWSLQQPLHLSQV